MARKSVKSAIVYPTCVRHLKPRKDVRLRHFFLCDDCADRWSNEAFEGNQAVHVGEPVRGYCLLCNLIHEQVRMRTWFLCDICYRVAGSIGRNHVAETAILDFWQSSVLPRFPNLILTQTMCHRLGLDGKPISQLSPRLISWRVIRTWTVMCSASKTKPDVVLFAT